MEKLHKHLAPMSSRSLTDRRSNVSRLSFVRWFRDITLEDIPAVGGKNASLGEMYCELTPRGVRIPDGFAITADAYQHFWRQNDLEKVIQDSLRDANIGDVVSLRACGKRIRDAILAAELPFELREQIVEAYDRL